MLIPLILLSLTPLSVQALCSATNKSTDDYSQCCSFYGYLGALGSQLCFDNCNPLGSYSATSCQPQPICRDTKVNFSDLSRVQQNYSAWNNDASAYDAVIQTGSIIPQASSVLLPITQSGPLAHGTRISLVPYMLYGEFTARMRMSAVDGLVTAIIGMSDILDEIDISETPADRPTESETNVWWQGIKVSATVDKIPNGGVRGDFHDYKIIWTADKLVWLIDGIVTRTLLKADTLTNGVYHFPSTPMRMQISIWNADYGGVINSWAGNGINWLSDEYYAEIESMTLKCGSAPPAGMTGYEYTGQIVNNVPQFRTTSRALVYSTKAPSNAGTVSSSSSSAVNVLPSTGACSKSYTVVGGDFCNTIASRNGISVAQLKANNAIINSDCSNLMIGSVLCITYGTPTVNTSVRVDAAPPSVPSPSPSPAQPLSPVSGIPAFCATLKQACVTASNSQISPWSNNACIAAAMCYGPKGVLSILGISGNQGSLAFDSNIFNILTKGTTKLSSQHVIDLVYSSLSNAKSSIWPTSPDQVIKLYEAVLSWTAFSDAIPGSNFGDWLKYCATDLSGNTGAVASLTSSTPASSSAPSNCAAISSENYCNNLASACAKAANWSDLYSSNVCFAAALCAGSSSKLLSYLTCQGGSMGPAASLNLKLATLGIVNSACSQASTCQFTQQNAIDMVWGALSAIKSSDWPVSASDFVAKKWMPAVSWAGFSSTGTIPYSNLQDWVRWN